MSDLVVDHLEIVREIILARNIRTIVETGTGPRSSGLQTAARYGLAGYSCDVYLPCVEHARSIFPDAVIYHSESLAFLDEVLPQIEGPTFFWLDGHCPTDPDDLPGLDFPPYEEIEHIKRLKRGYEQDVLWLDDIPMVTDPANPVATPWDVMLAGRRWTGASEHTWAQYMEVLADTHTAQIVGPVLRFEPK